MSQPIHLLLTPNDIAGWNWQRSRERLMRAAEEYAKKIEARPLNPGMTRPFNCPFFECNEAALHWLAESNDKSAPPIRPANKCMMLQPYSEPHRCFHPEGHRAEWHVYFYEPPSPFYLPMREFQPEWIQKEYRVKFCCPDAAFLYAEEQEREGKMNVRISDGERDENVSEYANRFYGLEPCWKK